MFVDSKECPDNPAPDKGHEPDWNSLTTEHDGDGLYVDVCCIHCGLSGCVGNERTLTENINWS